jgi:uncharacterized protein (TIGR00645 family)
MRQIERAFETTLLLSRWLLAPFLLGLVCCLLILLYRFGLDLYELAHKVPASGWHELVVDVLNLVDVALTANLVLIVVFAGYENFIRTSGAEANGRFPEGLADIDFGDLEKYADTSKLGWVLAFPLVLVVALLLLAVADRLGRK